MSVLRSRIVRFSTVMMGMMAWLAISNHCALAGLEPSPEIGRPSCHSSAPAQKTPAKHDHGSRVECCKVLRATLITSSDNAAASGAAKLAPHDYVVAVVHPAEALRLSEIIEWDTGPPRAIPFAESVLQRSLLAHAPPFLA